MAAEAANRRREAYRVRRGAEPVPRVIRTDTTFSARDELLVHMIGWTIECYFGEHRRS